MRETSKVWGENYYIKELEEENNIKRSYEGREEKDNVGEGKKTNSTIFVLLHAFIYHVYHYT